MVTAVFILIGCWLPLMFTIGWYLLSRRGISRGRSVVLFDISVVAIIIFSCIAFWWRVITGHPGPEDLDFLQFTLPFWCSLIAMPLFVVANGIRERVFRTSTI
jgi:hypothetical protein